LSIQIFLNFGVHFSYVLEWLNVGNHKHNVQNSPLPGQTVCSGEHLNLSGNHTGV